MNLNVSQEARKRSTGRTIGKVIGIIVGLAAAFVSLIAMCIHLNPHPIDF